MYANREPPARSRASCPDRGGACALGAAGSSRVRRSSTATISPSSIASRSSTLGEALELRVRDGDVVAVPARQPYLRPVDQPRARTPSHFISYAHPSPPGQRVGEGREHRAQVGGGQSSAARARGRHRRKPPCRSVSPHPSPRREPAGIRGPFHLRSGRERLVRAVDAWQRAIRWRVPPSRCSRKFRDDDGNALRGRARVVRLRRDLAAAAARRHGLRLRRRRFARRPVVSTLQQFPVIGSGFTTGEGAANLHGSGLGLADRRGRPPLRRHGCDAQRAADDGARVGACRPNGGRRYRARLERGLAALVVIGVAFVVTAFASGVVTSAGRNFVVRVAVFVQLVAVNVGLYLVSFLVLTPPGTTGWRPLLPGSVLAGAGFTLLTTVGTGLVQHQLKHMSDTYGAFASVIGIVTYPAPARDAHRLFGGAQRRDRPAALAALAVEAAGHRGRDRRAAAVHAWMKRCVLGAFAAMLLAAACGVGRAPPRPRSSTTAPRATATSTTAPKHARNADGRAESDDRRHARGARARADPSPERDDRRPPDVEHDGQGRGRGLPLDRRLAHRRRALRQVGDVDDGHILDPTRPESLVYEYRNGQQHVVAAMFMLPWGSRFTDIPDVGGALTQWHVHSEPVPHERPAAEVPRRASPRSTGRAPRARPRRATRRCCTCGSCPTRAGRSPRSKASARGRSRRR